MNRPPAYRAPWWLPGGHLQTIFPVARKAPLPAYRRERWDTPDGDFIDLDWVDPSTQSVAPQAALTQPQTEAPRPAPSPIFVLFHGLEIHGAHVALRGEVLIHVPDVGDAARHAGREV